MRTLTCPRCRKPWEVDALHAGMKAVCPNCHASITISAGPTAAKSSPTSVRSDGATMASAPAIAKPAAANLPEAVQSKASGDSISAAAQAAPSRIADTPSPPIMPAPPPPTVFNGSTSPAHVQPTREIAAQATHDFTDASAAISRPQSRRLMPLAAALILVAGGIAAIWRPWEQRPEQPVGDLTPNKGLPISPAASTPTTSHGSPLSTTEPPPVIKAPSTEPKLAVPTPSVIKPDPVAKPSNNSVPSVKPLPTASPTPSIAQPRAVSAPPAATLPTIRKPAPPPTYNRAPLEPGSEGTQAVTPQTPLKAGDHLHGQYEGRWYAVTVVETLDDGNVRVRWDTWGRDIVGGIPRNRLRLPTKK